MFADDLILFCKENNELVKILLRGFATFSVASGLKMNNNKSKIYFNCVKDVMTKKVIQTSGFKERHLPFKYLGVSIPHQRLTKGDCNILIERMVTS